MPANDKTRASDDTRVKQLLSVVIPVYQNELNLPSTHTELSSELARLSSTIEYELVFVNDGSTDASLDVLHDLQRRDPSHVAIINLVRNFGQVPALLAGFREARGDCVVVISADLQDPPSLIAEMVEAWRSGERLVIATRRTRNDGALARLTSAAFYRLMRMFSLPDIPTGGFDFFLADRKLVDIVSVAGETNPFIQGLVLWPGYRPRAIPYDRRKRTVGRSEWRLGRKIKYFIDGFVGYSFVPIRMVSISGIGVFILGMLGAAAVVVQRIVWGTRLQGWSSTMAALLVLSGLQMLMLGVLGEYLWRAFDQARNRPLYLVDSVRPAASTMQTSGTDTTA
jgi:dolichol-phosphate mannosyltransferase